MLLGSGSTSILLLFSALVILDPFEKAEAQTITDFRCVNYQCSNLTRPFCVEFSPYQNSQWCKPCNPDDYSEQGCDCPLGQYCGRDVRSSGPQIRGLCQAYTLTNKACTKASDCVTYSTDLNGNQQHEELQYCVQGLCKPCNGANSPIYTQAAQCQGWLNGQLQTSNPGLLRQCTSDGTLLSSGTVDYTLGLVSPSRTPTASLSQGAQPSSTSSPTHTPTASLSFGASPSASPSLGFQQGGSVQKQKKTSSALMLATSVTLLVILVLAF